MPAHKPRLNRRRYLEVTRLLKETIANKSVALKVRLGAADTLLSVYDRHDKAAERKSRTAEPDAPAQPEPQPVAEETAEDAARRFLKSIGKGTNEGE